MTKTHEKGSGNVFADLGFPNSEQELLKADLTVRIYKLLKERELTQSQAATLLGTTQAQVSALMRCRPVSVSVGRLMEFLTVLGQNVQVVVKPARKHDSRPHVRRCSCLSKKELSTLDSFFVSCGACENDPLRPGRSKEQIAPTLGGRSARPLVVSVNSKDEAGDDPLPRLLSLYGFCQNALAAIWRVPDCFSYRQLMKVNLHLLARNFR